MFRFVIAFLAAAFCAAESGSAIASERWSDARVFIARPGVTAGGPWSPMNVEKTVYRGSAGLAVSCWGRQYIFTAASVFPTQIISQGQELLSAPIVLAIQGMAAPSAAISPELPKVSIGPLAADDERVTFQAAAGMLEAEITIEFDGYLWADVCLAGTGSVGKADLIIPMTSATARYYNFGESGWDLERAGVVGGDGWGWSALRGASDKYVDEAGTFAAQGGRVGRGGWQPIVTLCSDQVGLSWFAEDYRNWTGSKDIAIVCRGDRVAMQVGIIGAEATLPRRFSFGLQAVPLKPLPVWHYSQKRFFNETPLEMLDKLGKGWGTFMHTTSGMAREPYFSYYPCPENPQAFHDYVAECRGRGLRVLHYLTTHYVSETVPGLQAAWQVSPVKRIGPYSGSMAAGMCPNTAWRDFWVENIMRKTLQLYPELEGLYFDCTTPMGCASAEHGCAPYCFQWRAEREMLKKAYILVKNRARGGLVQLHSSGFRWVTPCLSFVDARLSGEFLDHNVDDEMNRYHAKGKQPTFPPNEVNLAKFRSAMQPHSWGIPVTMLSFDRDAYIQAILDKKTTGDPTTAAGHRFGNPNESAAWFAVHDSCVCPTIADHFRYGGLPCTCLITRDIWDILESFGASYQNWCGYWYDSPPASVSGPNTEMVRASAYIKKGHEALLVIGNLGREAVRAQVAIDYNVLGLTADQVDITDVAKGDWLMRGDVTRQGNRLSLDLPGAREKGCLRFIKVGRRE